MTQSTFPVEERQRTDSPYNKILTNTHCWTYDNRKIVYDVRSAKAGDIFDGNRIEAIEIESGKTEILYESTNGASCGVVTCSPVDDRVVFIHGPENPDESWSYSFQHRRGVIRTPDGRTETLDACNVVAPLQVGALRGGSHVHVFSGNGRFISFTYNDHILNELDRKTKDNPNPGHDRDQRNVGVAVPLGGVTVNRLHPRHHDGTHFCVLVTETKNSPRHGSDEILKAYEEAWIGRNGYVRPDGTRQKYALAFLGDLIMENGQAATELFLVDLPEEFDAFYVPGTGPLEGTMNRRPAPPQGVVQRRLTWTTQRKHVSIQGPRHWPRSSPDGSEIAFLMKDEQGIVQIWTISPNGGSPRQWTRHKTDVASAFSWSPDGRWIAHASDNAIFVSSQDESFQLTQRSKTAEAPLPQAVVFSPNGGQIAFVKNVPYSQNERYNQIFTVDFK